MKKINWSRKLTDEDFIETDTLHFIITALKRFK